VDFAESAMRLLGGGQALAAIFSWAELLTTEA
jgi:hypothetical protein